MTNLKDWLLKPYELKGAEAFVFGTLLGCAVFHAFALGVVGLIDLIYGA